MKWLLIIISAVMNVSAAHAANVDVQVRGQDGKPVANAVVMIDSAARKPGGPIRFAWPNLMAQQNVAFDPHVLVVPVGASVSFPNRDKLRHHVYSFSRPKPFELKLYGREESRSILFDKVGAVSLGCNIHDAMSGFIMVVDTPFAAKTDANGRVSLRDVPAGGATLRIWHPYARIRGNELSQAVTIPATGFARIATMDIRKPAGRP